MSDRHIRRTGSDYRDAFLELLPQGQAWPKHSIESVLWQACDGLNNYWGYVDGRAADLLEIESDPRITVELLPDWERNWGLPDPCYTAPRGLADRQKALIARMTLTGSQSREFYINFAAFLGYDISITEYRTFVCGIDRCGDNRVYGDGSVPYYNPMFVLGYLPVENPNGEPVGNGELSEYPNYGLGPPTNRYYWTVHTHSASLTWFRCGAGGGQCGVDPFLRIGYAKDLECILNRWKPAHTHIVFDYLGMVAVSQGSAFGVGSASAVGIATVARNLAAGLGTASAVGRTTATAKGSSAGLGTAAANSSTPGLFQTTGSAAGVGTATASSTAVIPNLFYILQF